MTARTAATLLLLLGLTAAASAQDGGKIEWMGKGSQSALSALDDAVKNGRPILLFFTSEGNVSCKELSSGAFSDPGVVAASHKISCVFVECANGKMNAEIVKLMQVTKYPTIVFLDAEGRPLGSLPARDAAGIAGALKDHANRAALLPRWPEDLDAALRQAKKAAQPLLIYFYDDSPGSLTINRSILDPEMKSLRHNFVLAKCPMTKGTEVCVKYDVDRAPTILVLDPSLPAPEAKPLTRITASRTPRELHRDLDEAVTSLRSGPGPGPSSLPLPSTTPRPGKEELSNDDLDRKFIQARLDVANGLIQKKKTREAIDVLEDLIKSYPKHVATADAAKLLEQIQK